VSCRLGDLAKVCTSCHGLGDITGKKRSDRFGRAILEKVKAYGAQMGSKYMRQYCAIWVPILVGLTTWRGEIIKMFRPSRVQQFELPYAEHTL
jgi:hypothetical protein